MNTNDNTPSEQRGFHDLALNIYTRQEHNISRKQISDNALKVLYRLNGAGFDAFLVGGGVRDLLLGSQPKDFDIATNATPEQLSRLGIPSPGSDYWTERTLKLSQARWPDWDMQAYFSAAGVTPSKKQQARAN